LSDSFGSLVADCREEVEELLALSIASAARLEGVAKEVERDVFAFLSPFIILAVDDPGFLRVELQTAFRKTFSDRLHHGSSLAFSSAMDYRIVSVSFETQTREGPLHPAIECIVQNQICESR